MYRKVTDFVADYREDAREAQQNWGVLTDESLSSSAGEGYMTLGEQLWHIASLWQYIFVNDLKLWPVDKLGETPPAAAQALAEHYRQAVAEVTDWVAGNWTDEDMLTEIELWGMKLTQGKLLFEMVKHEAHHRGQIVILMRLAGLPVHGVYGPSREEVEAMRDQAAETP